MPKQPALGKYNDAFGGGLYLLEERPSGNRQELDNFGNSKKIISKIIQWYSCILYSSHHHIFNALKSSLTPTKSIDRTSLTAFHKLTLYNHIATLYECYLFDYSNK